MAGSAFAVMREGMAGKAGIGKVALYGREYLVAVRPQKKGLVMYTLHHDAEIRSIDQIEELNSVPSKVKPEEMKLAKQVIATFDGELNLKDYKDEYKEGLRKIIDAKIAGEEIVAPEVQEPPKVVDLMEALRRSLDSVSGDKKKPAKAIIKKPVTRPRPERGEEEEGGLDQFHVPGSRFLVRVQGSVQGSGFRFRFEVPGAARRRSMRRCRILSALRFASGD